MPLFLNSLLESGGNDSFVHEWRCRLRSSTHRQKDRSYTGKVYNSLIIYKGNVQKSRLFILLWCLSNLKVRQKHHGRIYQYRQNFLNTTFQYSIVIYKQYLKLFLIPQNSKRRSESQKSLNPAITSSESKAEFTSVNSEMTGNKDKIINYCTNPAAFDSTMTNGHIIFLH